jgi:death on curing protein
VGEWSPRPDLEETREVIEDVYFLTVEEVVEIHADQIDRYGGDAGVRDLGLLESAVHAAQNVAAYGETCDLCDMAAAYLFHIAENQPFVDGNKRAALASGLVFLHQNGVAVEDPEGILYDTMIRVATKEIGKPRLASVLRSLLAPSV